MATTECKGWRGRPLALHPAFLRPPQLPIFPLYLSQPEPGAVDLSGGRHGGRRRWVHLRY
jgi:hypothetical protein